MVASPHFSTRESDDAEPGDQLPQDPEPDPGDAGVGMVDAGEADQSVPDAAPVDAGVPEDAAPEPGGACPSMPCVCEGVGCTISWQRPNLDITIRYADRWNSGYRAVVTIQNTTDQQVDWQVGFNVFGTIRSVSGAEFDQDSGYVTFTPLFWNTPIDPNQAKQMEIIGAL